MCTYLCLCSWIASSGGGDGGAYVFMPWPLWDGASPPFLTPPGSPLSHSDIRLLLYSFRIYCSSTLTHLAWDKAHLFWISCLVSWSISDIQTFSYDCTLCNLHRIVSDISPVVRKSLFKNKICSIIEAGWQFKIFSTISSVKGGDFLFPINCQMSKKQRSAWKYCGQLVPVFEPLVAFSSIL